MVIAQTERLVLDRLAIADAAAFSKYRNDPEVARYQSWDELSCNEVDSLITSQATLTPGTPGAWLQVAVRLKATGQLIGDCGVFVESDDPRLGEIGFTFDRGHQGQGLATEATQALLRFAFEVLTLHRIKAVVDSRNTPAVRLLERIGFRREGHFLQSIWFKGAWCDEYVYALLRTDWQNTLQPTQA